MSESSPISLLQTLEQREGESAHTQTNTEYVLRSSEVQPEHLLTLKKAVLLIYNQPNKDCLMDFTVKQHAQLLS